MNNPKKLLELQELYIKKMCGIEFIDIPNTIQKPQITDINDTIKHCHLCPRSKTQKPSIGYINQESNLTFIVENPIGDINHLFESKSSHMLKNIAQNVFKTDSFSALSIVKCGNNDASPEEIESCKPYIFAQIQELKKGNTIVMFGEKILNALFNLDFTHKGIVLELYKKKCIATYSLGQLLRNPALKKEAMQHFYILQKYTA